jgi:uncharacterized membrane protein (UPF0136 family)
MEQTVAQPENPAQESGAGRGRAIAGLIVSLVGGFMVAAHFYWASTLMWILVAWFAVWEGVNLALGIAAVVLAAPGLRDSSVHCMAVVSVVLGAFEILLMLFAMMFMVPGLSTGF